MAVAAEVPGKYDVVIDGQGYILANTEIQRAIYGYTPTFVTRQNVSGNYGDNQQDFWLTFSQNDWSLGEGQKFIHLSDEVSRRRFWSGTNLDVSIPGQAQIADATTSISFTGTAIGAAGTAYTDNKIYVVDATNLFSISGNGTKTDLGAHGAGTPYSRALVADGNFVLIGGQTPKIRKYNILTPGFSDFSSTAVTDLCFVANTLFGVTSSMNEYGYFSTAGAYTTAYSWQSADGTAKGVVTSIHSYGGQVFIVRSSGEEYTGPELWTGDTTGAQKVGSLPPNFRADEVAVAYGIAFIAGAFVLQNATKFQPAIYYYANGNVGLAWKATSPSTNLTVPTVTAFKDGIVFTDESTGSFLFYDLASGCINTIGSFTTGSVSWNNSQSATLAASGTSFVHTRNGTTTYFFPSTSKATSATLTTSLIDFESSLDKYVKAVKVDFDAATDGNGGSVDIAYRLNDVDSTYTTVQSGATAGTEYTVGQSCRSISIKVTLNKGTSTNGPVLKRIYVRAAPTLQQFRRGEYVLDLTGRDGETPVMLRNGNPHPLDGLSQASNLRTSALKTTPISITDRFGTFTGITELDALDLIEIRPEEFLARIKVRQV